MDFTDILSGTQTHTNDKRIVQRVGAMAVIPLLGDDFTQEELGEFADIKIGTSTYGTITAENKSDKPVIIPAYGTFLTKQKAQDHALPYARVIGKKNRANYPNAMCVQDTQDGTISAGIDELRFLPFQLRERSFKERNRNEFGKLWEDIRSLNRTFDTSGGGWIVTFFDKMKSELDQFIGEFEPIENQIGAIIIINDKVVGIERWPTADHWKKIWKPIIRDCYAALALEVMRKSGGKTLQPAFTTPLKGRPKNIQDLRKIYDQAEAKEAEAVRNMIGGFINEDVTYSKDGSTVAGFTTDQAESASFFGYVIRSGTQPIYVSMASKAMPEAQRIRKRQSFSI